MIREKGVVATSMRDLAEAVGLEAASLYNHIQSKADILREIVFRTANDCNAHLNSLEGPKTGAVQQIEALIRFHVRMMVDRFDDYMVMVNEWSHLQEPYLGQFTAQRRTYVQRMEGLITEGIRNREMKPVHPYVAVLSILSSVRGLEFWHRSTKRLPAAELEDHMVSYLIHGLKK